MAIIRVDITLVGLLFWLVFAGFVVLADSGLYMVAWQRSILAESQHAAGFNRRLQGTVPYDALDTTIAVENDGMLGYTDDQVALRTLDREQPRDHGPVISQFNANFRDCADLRKLIRLPNTNRTALVTMPQLLSDQTFNFLRCVLVGRLSGNPS
jgi:hypothetical protein